MKKFNLKKVASCTLAAAMVLSMAACGKKDAENNGSSVETNSNVASQSDNNAANSSNVEYLALSDVDVEKIVTLGDYKSITIKYDPIVITDEEVKEEMNSALSYVSSPELGIMDRAVEEGDTVNIDYTGYQDGEAFQGGTDTGYNLTIGSHSFIDGFESQLVGIMPGETVNIDCTFPTDYWNPDMAGVTVTFEVTVNFIAPTELTDEIVAALAIDGVSTVAELETYIRDFLYEDAEAERESALESRIMNELVSISTFNEIPEALTARYAANMTETITTYASYYQTDAETLVASWYGMAFDEWLKVNSETAAKQYIAMQAIANREGLAVDDETLQAELEAYTAQAGAASVEEFLGDVNREEYREYLMYENVVAYLYDNVTIAE